jgi:MFS family permease
MNAIRANALAVLTICVMMNMLARGTSETFAVFLLPFEQAFDASRAELTGVYSVYMLIHGLSSPFIGALFDRFGARLTYGIGLLALAAGYGLAARAEQAWQLYLSLGLLVGIGVAALSMVTASGLIARWYRARLGTAMGIAYAGYGLGVIAIVPLTQIMIASQGWRATYNMLAFLLLVMFPVIMLLPWKRWRAGHGEHSLSTRDAGKTSTWTLRTASTDSAFWGLFGAFYFTAAAIYCTTIQAVVYLVDVGFTALQAATAFGLVGFLSTAGMGISGWLSDRIGARRTVSVTFTLTITGIVMFMGLSTYPSMALLGVAILCFGIPAGSRGPVISTLAAGLFAGRGIGAIYGAITMGMGVGAGVGSWASGMLYDLTSNYQAGFMFAAFNGLCGLSLFYLVPALKHGKRH